MVGGRCSCLVANEEEQAKQLDLPVSRAVSFNSGPVLGFEPATALAQILRSQRTEVLKLLRFEYGLFLAFCFLLR